MTKESPSPMSKSKSSSLPERTNTSPSLNNTSNALKLPTETSHHSQRIMDMIDILAMIFPDNKTAVNITRGRVKFGKCY